MKTVLLAAVLAVMPMAAMACVGEVSVCDGTAAGSFSLVKAGVPATVYVDAAAPRPVLRVAADFAADLERVSGKRPAVVHSLDGVTGDVVVIGQAGQVAGLARDGAVAGRWEAYQQSVADLGNGRHALVIQGADPRGTIYGTYDISAKMGVSPWYWWADVPVVHKDDVYVTAGTRSDAPKVKYRGFFINDEEPAFGGWAREKFGGINHLAYEKVFELDLRLKGNYLWPAMWGKSIADDDPQTLDTADDYGVVLGTSHHEPMTRAQDEWHRHTDQGITGGKWDYTKNTANLRAFWRGGIERMVQGHHENVVTVGMRGDGDEPMSEGTATALLEQIVTDQRQIIADVTGKPADQTPQVWALYKEVQDYYDHGMKVPDDVTLLFADDNWGQIRRLPDPKAPPRKGGYGVYYHFDYVGGPRNYKWINTNQIEKTWQQMDLAWASGVDRLWIVNVGDIKPMEYPLSFFMDMAWNPEAMTPEALKAYPAQWAGQQFGADHAQEIGGLLTFNAMLASRRKPELLDTDNPDVDESQWDDAYTFVRLTAHRVAGRADAERVTLTPAQQTAFDELVGYQVSAMSNLYDLYGYARLARREKAAHAETDDFAVDGANAAFKRDADLAAAYNSLAGGKWNHMMDQTHIGYTSWQQPDTNVMPSLEPTDLTPAEVLDAPPLCDHFDAVCRLHLPAETFTRQVDGKGMAWITVPFLGRANAVVSYPQAEPATAVDDGVRLEYDVEYGADGAANLSLNLAPTLDTRGQGGLRLAVGIDDQPVQTLTFNLVPNAADWNKAVSDNLLTLKAQFAPLKAGRHTLRLYRIDGNVVVESLELDAGKPVIARQE